MRLSYYMHLAQNNKISTPCAFIKCFIGIGAIVPNSEQDQFVVEIGEEPVSNPTGKRLGRMVKADDSSPRGPGFDSHESVKTFFLIYSMNVMINAPMTSPDLE